MRNLCNLTPKERKKIYLEIAENYAKGLDNDNNWMDEIFELNKSYFICNSLLRRLSLSVLFNPFHFFPELAYFEPLATDDKDEGCEGGWFKVHDKIGYQERILVLLFCAELCDENLEILK